MYISYIFEFSIDSCNILCARVWFSSFVIEESYSQLLYQWLYTSSMDILFNEICWNERRLKNLRIEYIFWNMILPLRVNIYSQIFFWSWYTCCSCIWYMSSQNASSVNNLERSRTIANGTTTSDDESSEISFPSLFSHSLPKKPWRCY